VARSRQNDHRLGGSCELRTCGRLAVEQPCHATLLSVEAYLETGVRTLAHSYRRANEKELGRLKHLLESE
jgi:hypothetical protein